jgi:hypothetical protein
MTVSFYYAAKLLILDDMSSPLGLFRILYVNTPELWEAFLVHAIPRDDIRLQIFLTQVCLCTASF